MKVVLDKSALVGASEQVLRQFASGRSYILTPMLRYEIATGARRTTLKCERTLRKLRGMWLADPDVLVGWEIENGRSAQDVEAVWNSERVLDAGLLLADQPNVGNYEDGWARVGKFKYAPDDAPAIAKIRRMQKPELYQSLENRQATTPLARLTEELWSRGGEEHGLKVSRRFKPTPDWLCYGLQLVTELAVYWKAWRYGNDPAHAHKPANFGLDLTYVAFMALADGLLTAEASLLDFAWACWPAKRAGLHLYDMRLQEIIAYKPPWASG